jgi:succinyl-diaminopimelate desuccinylase
VTAAQRIPALDLTADPVELAVALADVPTESGMERPLADAVQSALRAIPHLRVDRDGDAVVARTDLGRPQRVLLAGHLDTVPVADNLPVRRDADRLYGCGTTDMKAAVAVALHLAATVPAPAFDLTLVCYDQEEVEASRNGLGRLMREHPDWLRTDLAILMEPTSALVEAGCQGTLRVRITTAGRRAHSARSWLGDNAIHRLAPVLGVLADYIPRAVTLDGCHYREGLNAVGIDGGVAGNVIPDAASITVNFRFAPDRSPEQALAHLHEVFPGCDLVVTDSAAGALPRLAEPAAAAFVAAVAEPPVAKYGWTDVARFAALGVPALNYGPGDPALAHTREESVEIRLIRQCTAVLRDYITGAARR